MSGEVGEGMGKIKTVLVPGGAGYVGAVLVPKLLAQGYHVRVLDLYLYGDDVLGSVAAHPGLTQVKGDMRDQALLEKVIPGSDAIIHLACISNDPSFELNPALGKSINYDCFPMMVDLAIQNGVKRFVYASSSSVYGYKEVPNVTEDLALDPLTDYSRYKMLCEEVLLSKRRPGFVPLILRPATVCGYSPRQRLDLTVNILTNLAVHNRLITVFGGGQMRPNIHIGDVTDLYIRSLEWEDALIDGKIFNAGYENHRVSEIAEMVRRLVGDDVRVVTEPSNDNRSYHISSEKIARELGYKPKRSIEEAVGDLVAAFGKGLLPESLTDNRYFNVKRMQAIHLT